MPPRDLYIVVTIVLGLGVLLLALPLHRRAIEGMTAREYQLARRRLARYGVRKPPARTSARPPPPTRREHRPTSGIDSHMIPPPECTNTRYLPHSKSLVMDCTIKGQTRITPVIGRTCKRPVLCGRAVRCFPEDPNEPPPAENEVVNPYENPIARMMRLRAAAAKKRTSAGTEEKKPSHCKRLADYRNTCTPCNIFQGTLHCMCTLPGRQATMGPYELRNVETCRKNSIVRNRAGRLICRRQRAPPKVKMDLSASPYLNEMDNIQEESASSSMDQSEAL